MNHQVLYRKYRPLSFKYFTAQERLVSAIRLAAVSHKLSGAYLFTGSRGVGKTTAARILAKTANCESLSSSGDPCEMCTNCYAMNDSSHPDVVECDAASRTGVDDVRSIIESGRLCPILGSYRVYIIDEVHMLSQSAFNALLKTLEEPPSHLIFVLATTEVKKVPLTIVSRCQTFTLKQIPAEQIEMRLEEVCRLEKIVAEKDALRAIARISDGSMRDALAMLETAKISSTAVTSNLVEEIFAVPSVQLTQVVVTHLLNLESSLALEVLTQAMNRGVSARSLTKAIADCVSSMAKELMLSGVGATERVACLTAMWKLCANALAEQVYMEEYGAIEMLVVRIHYFLHNSGHRRTKEASVDEQGKDADRPVDARPASFRELIDLFRENKEPILFHQLMNEVRLASFEPPVIAVQISPDLPGDFLDRVSSKLNLWTNGGWVLVRQNSEEQSLGERERSAVLTNPLVCKVRDEFNGELEQIKC